MKGHQVSSFSEFFNGLEDDFLISLEPSQLQKLCMFLSLDLQMQEEERKQRVKALQKVLRKVEKQKKSSYPLKED